MNKGNEIKKHGLKKIKTLKKDPRGLIFFKQRKRDKLRDISGFDY